MRTVLFLCTGNYYRSRFAEAWFNHLAIARDVAWRADSRGLEIHPERNPGPISVFTIDRLAELGIELPQPLRFPLQVAEHDLQAARHVVAVKEAEHRPLLAQRFPAWTNRVEYWHVHDLDCAGPETALIQLASHVESLLTRLALDHAAA
jgi:protein-tyrosine phosphatase